MFSKNITIFSASQITEPIENLGINTLLHFKDQKVWSRRDFSTNQLREQKSEDEKYLQVFPRSFANQLISETISAKMGLSYRILELESASGDCFSLT